MKPGDSCKQNNIQQTSITVAPLVVRDRQNVIPGQKHPSAKRQTAVVFPNSQTIVPIQVVQVVNPYLPPILPNGIITIDTIQGKVSPKSRKQNHRKKVNNNKKKSPVSTDAIKRKCDNNKSDPITNFVKCLCKPSDIDKIGYLYSIRPNLSEETDDQEVVFIEDKGNKINIENITPIHLTSPEPLTSSNMLPSMPNLLTPLKTVPVDQDEVGEVDKKPVPRVSEKRNMSLEFSTISSSSFQQPNTSTEVEFCSQESTTGCNINQNIDNQVEINIKPEPLTETVCNDYCLKDNMDDINALMSASASTTSKPMAKKEPSGAEKRKAKKKRDFLSNLSVSTPEDRETEKQKNELFALAYYDKMRETLELRDYHSIMKILDDYEQGDAVELYKRVEVVLRPKYSELADEFLLFLREKEAAAVDRLIPWIRMNNRSKFLRKLEIYFKDHPAQLRKIYKCLAELSQTVDISTEIIKSTLLPMFKGNEVLSDLFLQNFVEEPPPLSLMEGPYEEMDIAKEMSKNDNEEPFEIFKIPDGDDKFGGPACICNCHGIEDPEFQSRYRHCTKCGIRFIKGRVYLQTGKGPRPAIVSFLNSANTNQNIRLMGNSSISMNQKKKRSDSSPSKLVSNYPSKENLDEETDEEGDPKKKTKKKPQKRRQKTPDKSPEHKRARKGSISKKTFPLAVQLKSSELNVKDLKSCANSGQERLPDESLEWDDQQTAESESEFCEESSQDNCESDNNSSVSSSNNAEDSYSKLQEENSSWSREEDKVILEVFQQENDKDNAFQVIASQLTDRTVEEIKSRFDTLMKLLLKTIEN